jgi:SHS2 domain-containing protein
LKKGGIGDRANLFGANELHSQCETGFSKSRFGGRMTENLYYVQIDHTADIGIRVFARDGEITTLFANAARALVDLHTDETAVRHEITRTVEANGQDWEDLLRHWLTELHFLYEMERLLLPKVSVTTLEENHIVAECTGEVFDAERHEARGEIKAVTHHGLEIWETEEDGLEAQVIFDL